MANTLMTPPEIDPGKQSPNLRPADAPHLVEETDGSMWSSLFANLRDAFSSSKQPPLQLESRPVDSDLILQEEGVFASLWSSVRDVFFPVKLPPLELESKPIAVVDRMAVKRDPTSTGDCDRAACAGDSADRVPAGEEDVALSAPRPVTTAGDADCAATAGGSAEGAGDGRRRRPEGPTPVTRATPPKFADTQIVPPKAPPLEEPKIKIPADGRGAEGHEDGRTARCRTSACRTRRWWERRWATGGNGHRVGNGSGIGPGSGGNYGGGPKRIGGGVSCAGADLLG